MPGGTPQVAATFKLNESDTYNLISDVILVDKDNNERSVLVEGLNPLLGNQSVYANIEVNGMILPA